MRYDKVRRCSLIVLILFMLVIHFHVVYAIESESDGNSSGTTYNYYYNNTYNYYDSDKIMEEDIETIADNKEAVTEEIESVTYTKEEAIDYCISGLKSMFMNFSAFEYTILFVFIIALSLPFFVSISQK